MLYVYPFRTLRWLDAIQSNYYLVDIDIDSPRSYVLFDIAYDLIDIIEHFKNLTGLIAFLEPID